MLRRPRLGAARGQRLPVVAPGGGGVAVARPTYIFFYGRASGELRADRLERACRAASSASSARGRDGGPAKLNCVTNPAVKAVTAVRTGKQTHAAMASSSRPAPSAGSTREVGYADADRAGAGQRRAALPRGACRSRRPRTRRSSLHPSRGRCDGGGAGDPVVLDDVLGCASMARRSPTSSARRRVGKESGAFVDDRALPAYVRASEAAARAARWTSCSRPSARRRRREGEGVRVRGRRRLA